MKPSIVSLGLGLLLTTLTAAGAPPGDPCALFTADEIAASMGRSDFGKGKIKSAPTGATCRYASSRGSLNVWVGPTTAKDFGEMRDLLAREGKQPQAVSGVGDEAYFWDERIYLRVGASGLTIYLGEPGGEAARNAVLALAKVGAGKLR